MVEMYDESYNVIELFVPKYCKMKDKFPGWFNNELRDKIIKKKRLKSLKLQETHIMIHSQISEKFVKS